MQTKRKCFYRTIEGKLIIKFNDMIAHRIRSLVSQAGLLASNHCPCNLNIMISDILHATIAQE
jgi:hypothetical protein